MEQVTRRNAMHAVMLSAGNSAQKKNQGECDVTIPSKWCEVFEFARRISRVLARYYTYLGVGI